MKGDLGCFKSGGEIGALAVDASQTVTGTGEVSDGHCRIVDPERLPRYPSIEG